MNQIVKKYVFLLVLLIPQIVQSQSKSISQKFRLERTLLQDGFKFQFFRGRTDSLNHNIQIFRIQNGIKTILFNEYVRDGYYKVADRDYDGYLDLILYYHDYDVIHFYDKKNHKFADSSIYMPRNLFCINQSKRIFCGYRDAQYSEAFDYSILYTYKSRQPYFYYKLVYRDNSLENPYDKTYSVSLYSFVKGNYESTVFVKKIIKRSKRKLNFISYWKRNYKHLLGNR